MWKRIRLGDYINISTGKLDANASTENGKFPFFTCAKDALKIDKFAYDCECVLVAGNGDLNVKYFNGKFNAYQRTYILEVINKDLIDTKYLYVFIDGYINTLRQQSVGGVIKYIKLGNLTEIEFPLPNIVIQRKITEILFHCQNIINIKQKQIDSLEKLLQDTFIEMFGDPIENPKGWDVHCLGLLLKKLGSGATPRGGDASYVEKGTSFIRSMNIYDNFFEKKGLAFISEIQAKQLEIVAVEKEDLLLNITGASVCRCCIVEEKILPARVNQHVSILRPKYEIINNIFLLHLLISDKYKNFLYTNAKKNGATREALTKEFLKTVPIILPPKQLQDKFAEMVLSIQKLLEVDMRELDKLNILSKALAEKCFNGDFFNNMREVNEVDSKVFDDKVIGKRINDAMPIKLQWRNIIQEYNDNQITLEVACEKLTKLMRSTINDNYNDIFDFVAKNIEQSIRMANSLNNLSKKLPIINQLHDKYLLQYKKRAIDTLTDEEIIEAIKMYLVPGSYVVEMFSQFFDIESVDDYDMLKSKIFKLLKMGELDQYLDRDEEILKSESADINDRLFLSKFMTLTRVK